MPVQRMTRYACDVPSCPVTFDGEESPPNGWAELESSRIGYIADDCDCECHSCDSGDEVKLTGHEEDDCPCQTDPYSWTIVVCPSHSEDLMRRFR